MDTDEVVEQCATSLLRQHRLRYPGAAFGPSSAPPLDMADARSVARAVITELVRIRGNGRTDPQPPPEPLAIHEGTGRIDVILTRITAVVPVVKALRDTTGITLAQAWRICHQPLPAIVIRGAHCHEAAAARTAIEAAGGTITLHTGNTSA